MEKIVMGREKLETTITFAHCGCVKIKQEWGGKEEMKRK